MRLLLPLLACCLWLGCRTNETPRAQVNDLEITAEVKSKLASDVGLSTLPDISVNCTNGVVTLSGVVDSPGSRAKAESIARSVPKVASVMDNLQVAPSPTGAAEHTPAGAPR